LVRNAVFGKVAGEKAATAVKARLRTMALISIGFNYVRQFPSEVQRLVKTKEVRKVELILVWL
jgi:hypothetical protein